MDDNRLIPDVTYHGFFWLEDDPEDKWQGSLQVQEDNSFYLHCTSPILEANLLMPNTALLGQLVGPINIRLDKCLGVSGRHLDQVRTVSASFGRMLASLGEVRQGSGERLRRTAVWLTELNGWWRIKSTDFGKLPNADFSVTVKSPKNIVLKDRMPRVTLQYLSDALNAPDKDIEATLVVGRPHIIVKHAALDLDQVRREVDIVQQFVTFCTGFAAGIERVETTAYATDSDVEQFVRGRYFPGWLEDDFRKAKPSHGRRLFRRYAIEFEALRPHIKAIYSQFREVYANHSLYVETLTASYFDTSPPDELRFATLVFAAEGLHRDTVGGKYISRTDYRTQYMAPIRAAIPNQGNYDLERHIYNSLGHCNEKSLKARLLELAEELPENVLAALFPDDTANVFLGKVVNTRNYLAHREPALAQNSFRVGNELTHGYHKFHAMLVCNMFLRLGIPENLLNRIALTLLNRTHVLWG